MGVEERGLQVIDIEVIILLYGKYLLVAPTVFVIHTSEYYLLHLLQHE